MRAFFIRGQNFINFIRGILKRRHMPHSWQHLFYSYLVYSSSRHISLVLLCKEIKERSHTMLKQNEKKKLHLNFASDLVHRNQLIPTNILNRYKITIWNLMYLLEILNGYLVFGKQVLNRGVKDLRYIQIRKINILQ